MRKVLLIGLALALLAGCKKYGSKTTSASDAGTTISGSNTAGTGSDVGTHAPTGIVIKPLQVGGSGGAVQAVRGAVTRAVTELELKELYTEITRMYSENNNKMPTVDAIKREVKQNPKLSKLLEDGDIQLTGTRNFDYIWAITMYPQTGGRLHGVVTKVGVERVDQDELKKRLTQELR